jgi:hypothetical protein
MGYDCTFHLIDEQAIQNEFVPKLLGQSRQQTPLDKVHKNAADLWAAVRRALQEGIDEEGEEIDEEDAASLLCQLACIYSSCFLPHHYERGLAFSLWPDGKFEEGFPPEFAHSPEPLFAEVVRQYPGLKGKFPQWFTGNYSTGVYIPAKNVNTVREWLETQLESLPKGERRLYRGLLATLRAAEEKKLAFWEATDLAIPMTGQVPGDPELMTADYLRNTPGGATPAEKVKLPVHANRVGGQGDLHILSHAIPDTTVLVDLSHWPLRHHVRSQEFAWNADGDRDGRWLLVSRTGPGDYRNPVRGRVFTDLRKEPELILRVEDNGAEVVVNDGFLVAGRVVLIPDTAPCKPGMELTAWMHDGEQMRPAPGLPPHMARKERSSMAWIVRDVARLADGSEVLVWDGEGYEWDGSRFQQTFPLGLTDAFNALSAIPVGEDGFFFITQRKLFEVHRGGKAVRHAPLWENIMAVLPGPAGGLLLKEGNNPDGDIGKLYFPADGTFIHIEPELLGDQDLYDFLCWSQGAKRIIASDGASLYAVPVETILALPRYDARTGKEASPDYSQPLSATARQEP